MFVIGLKGFAVNLVQARSIDTVKIDEEQYIFANFDECSVELWYADERNAARCVNHWVRDVRESNYTTIMRIDKNRVVNFTSVKWIEYNQITDKTCHIDAHIDDDDGFNICDVENEETADVYLDDLVRRSNGRFVRCQMGFVVNLAQVQYINFRKYGDKFEVVAYCGNYFSLKTVESEEIAKAFIEDLVRNFNNSLR